jgi:hypothetical protein
MEKNQSLNEDNVGNSKGKFRMLVAWRCQPGAKWDGEWPNTELKRCASKSNAVAG